jgi:hypothetical protein
MSNLASNQIVTIGIDIGNNSFHVIGLDKRGAIVLERGVAVRQGQRFLRAALPNILASPSETLSPRMARTIEELAGDWRRLDERIDSLSLEIETLARQDAGCDRLMSVRGVGPIISSAMVAAIGAGEVFSKGRDFAAWLGLVPQQISTGDRTILGKISKLGNRYLRALFLPAARVVLIRPKSWERHGLKSWIEAAKNGFTTTFLRSRSPTNSPASPGAFWRAIETLMRGRSPPSMLSRPDQPASNEEPGK